MPTGTVVDVDLLDATTGETVKHREINPVFAERRDTRSVAWEAPLSDVFQSDMRNKSGEQLKVGSYRISLRVAIGLGPELKTDNMHIQVMIMRGR